MLGLLRLLLQLASRQRGVVDDLMTPFGETGSCLRSHSESRSSSPTGSGSGSSSSLTSHASSQWSVKRRKLYAAMTEEERGLFSELQREIGELKRLLAASDGTAESKVIITPLYMKYIHKVSVT